MDLCYFAVLSPEFRSLVAGPLPIESSCPKKDVGQRAGNVIPTLPSRPRHHRSEELPVKKLDIAPVMPDVRPSHQRFISSSTRNDPCQSKLPPFHSYRWASIVNSIGGQQKHNVRPKSVGVHPSAHGALRVSDTSSKRSRELDAERGLQCSVLGVQRISHPP